MLKFYKTLNMYQALEKAAQDTEWPQEARQVMQMVVDRTVEAQEEGNFSGPRAQTKLVGDCRVFWKGGSPRVVVHESTGGWNIGIEE